MEITVKQYIESIHPTWTLADWLGWPPDTFALTAHLFRQTGAYMFAVLPPKGMTWPEESIWQQDLQDRKLLWYDVLFGRSKEVSSPVQPFQARIEQHWETVRLSDIQRLLERTTPYQGGDTNSTWVLCKALLELHALADEACAGFGTPSGTSWVSKEDHRFIHSMANMYLAHTGSLSRLPPHIARVLPKMRTPGVGMTLRSLSHHVTLHATEVDVRWRAMPWVNIDENTINILIVPWPYTMSPNHFRPSAYATQRGSRENVRYFHYDGPTTDTGAAASFEPAALLAMLADAKHSVSRVHMIIFPEAALTRDNHEALLTALAEGNDRDRMPMVLAGVRVPHPEATEADGLDENLVILSAFFAGKWYKIQQFKHHRWKLDGPQIRQYNLGGVLSGSKDWWEASKLATRRLSVLAPNNWLSLCPLICEDLARLEPVSDLIRGIGPTLLIAILLDGPQLRPRWPGRYASVLADDPGSSVLTISALGFTKRSQDSTGQSGSRVVALWKDQVSGFHEITVDTPPIDDAFPHKRLSDDLFCPGVVITVTASWNEETTADGRGDNTSAATFVYQGSHQVSGRRKAKDTSAEAGPQGPAPAFSVPTDLLEITLFSYFVDAGLGASPASIALLQAAMLGEHSALQPHERPALSDAVPIPGTPEALHLSPALQEVRATVRDKTGEILAIANHESFEPFVRWTCGLLRHLYTVANAATAHNGEVPTDIRRLKIMTDIVIPILRHVNSQDFITNWLQHDPYKGIPEALAFLREIKPAPMPEADRHREVRILIYGSFAILWAIHGRLAQYRRQFQLNAEGTRLLTEIEQAFRQRTDLQWRRAEGLNGEDGLDG